MEKCKYCEKETLGFVDYLTANGFVGSFKCCHKCWLKLRRKMKRIRPGLYYNPADKLLYRYYRRDYRPIQAAAWLYLIQG